MGRLVRCAEICYNERKRWGKEVETPVSLRESKAERFERLVAEYERPVYLLCLRMMGNREDALDCAQEAMLSAYRAFDRFQGDTHMKTWLYRIAHNTCIDALRRRKNITSLDVLHESGFDVPDSAEKTPHMQLEAQERQEAVRQAVRQLPDEQRAALILRDFQNTSYEDIARILQLPEGTVKSRINRAREKLRQILLKNGEQNEICHVQQYEGRQKK